MNISFESSDMCASFERFTENRKLEKGQEGISSEKKLIQCYKWGWEILE